MFNIRPYDFDRTLNSDINVYLRRGGEKSDTLPYTHYCPTENNKISKTIKSFVRQLLIKINTSISAWILDLSDDVRMPESYSWR